jgi:hypothetical protein
MVPKDLISIFSELFSNFTSGSMAAHTDSAILQDKSKGTECILILISA